MTNEQVGGLAGGSWIGGEGWRPCEPSENKQTWAAAGGRWRDELNERGAKEIDKVALGLALCFRESEDL